MPAKNIECQLAQGQIGRYLNGDRISPEAVRQLEAHIAECDDCTQTLSTRRQAILTMLEGSVSGKAVVQTEDSPLPEPNPEPATKACRKLSAKGKAELLSDSTPGVGAEPTGNEPKAPPSLVKALTAKPLLYATGLAVVLLVMSFYSRSAAQAFGPTAAEMLPSAKGASTSTVRPHQSQPPQLDPALSQPKTAPAKGSGTIEDNPPKISPPVQHPQSRPPAPIRPVRITVRPVGQRHRRLWPTRARHQRPQSAIRVYDPQGNQLQETP